MQVVVGEVLSVGRGLAVGMIEAVITAVVVGLVFLAYRSITLNKPRKNFLKDQRDASLQVVEQINELLSSGEQQERKILLRNLCLFFGRMEKQTRTAISFFDMRDELVMTRIAKSFDVLEATIERDLDELAADKLFERPITTSTFTVRGDDITRRDTTVPFMVYMVTPLYRYSGLFKKHGVDFPLDVMDLVPKKHQALVKRFWEGRSSNRDIARLADLKLSSDTVRAAFRLN